MRLEVIFVIRIIAASVMSRLCNLLDGFLIELFVGDRPSFFSTPQFGSSSQANYRMTNSDMGDPIGGSLCVTGLIMQ